ncbi:LacI family DNA-binding transcriptional regulator [Sphingomonas adhaesiva]|uniref:LacI family DNA-binding transcriptional regulator n=1 Tax=Sphingomonas adhaesiva TaxID=28212 RepID=UPI002FF77DFF
MPSCPGEPTPGEPQKVRTIGDLARLAGVSPATVSRALAGNRLVNATTSQRVRQLAEAHAFKPSAVARNLRIRRRGAIAVVICLGHERGQHLSDPFFMTMISHLADELTDRGFQLMLSRVVPDSDDWLDDMIAADPVDGFILIGQSDQLAALERAAAGYLPLVAWGAHGACQRHCSVGSDNVEGGRLATRHLIERGCRRIAFLGNPRSVEIAHRLAGAREVVRAQGGRVSLIETPIHLSTTLSGHDIAAFLASADALPDGMFAATDSIAVNALQVLTGRGVAVPGDVKLVGYDDLPIAAASVPALTTVRQDFAQGARMLVQRLFDRIAGERNESVVLPAELVVRATS